MLTKPCTRGGCTATVNRKRPDLFDKAKYCSRRCAAIDRLCAGWMPHAPLMRPEVLAISHSRGGKAAAVKARQRRAQRICEKLAGLLTHPVFDGLSHQQRAAMKVLLGKAYQIGVGDRDRRDWYAKRAATSRKAAA